MWPYPGARISERHSRISSCTAGQHALGFVPAMLSPAGTHQGHFSRDLIGICFGALRAGRFDKWCGVCLNFGGEEPRLRESVVFGGGVGGTNKN